MSAARSSPQQVFFGTEYRPNAPSSFVVPIEAVAGLFFVLIALMFVGLGQRLGRCRGAIPDRVAAYSINVLGSLAGIVAFAGPPTPGRRRRLLPPVPAPATSGQVVAEPSGT
jgi:hypothetical protein